MSLCIPLTSFGRITAERLRPHRRDGSRPAAPDTASSVSRAPPSIDPRQCKFHRCLCVPIVCRRYLCLRRVLEIQKTLSARNGSCPRCRAHRGSHVRAGQSVHTSKAASRPFTLPRMDRHTGRPKNTTLTGVQRATHSRRVHTLQCSRQSGSDAELQPVSWREIAVSLAIRRPLR